jgi:ribonuclease J
MTSSDMLEIVPLGGLGEFGMNTMSFRCGGDIVVVDAGLMFPRDDLLGVDMVVPDLRYLVEHRDEIRAVILTHGHEDHIGGLPYLLEELDVPVYGTALTLGFVRGRLEEHALLDRVALNCIQARDTLNFGNITIEFIGVTHSIADNVSLAITTPQGTIIHTGDFKFDQAPPDGKFSDYARFSHFGEQGVLALFSDSTNAERPGYTLSESFVRSQLEKVFHTSRRKIIMACFASSIHRIQIILELAAAFGRRVVPAGRRMKQNIAIAGDLDYLRFPQDILVDAQEASNLPDEEVLLLCTGSQGEPMAALAQLALGKHKTFAANEDDTVIISARTIPGNESRISHVINHFYRRGVRVFDDSRWAIHASGHASQEELKLMLNLTRPKFFIPIHGEYRQLYNHALIAMETGLPKERVLMVETGDIISLSSEAAHVTGKAPVGRRLIDEGGGAEVDEFVVQDRIRLSEEGVVLAVVAIDKASGQVQAVPDLVSRGHVAENEGESFLAEARQVVLKTLEECTEEERRDSLLLTESIRADLKRFFKKRTGTRPLIVPLIMEI